MVQDTVKIIYNGSIFFVVELDPDNLKTGRLMQNIHLAHHLAMKRKGTLGEQTMRLKKKKLATCRRKRKEFQAVCFISIKSEN